MLNSDIWQPSKFLCQNDGQLRANRDVNEVAISSRLVTDAIAGDFARFIPQYCSGLMLDLGCGKAPLFGTYKNYIIDVMCVDWVNSFHDLSYIDISCDLSKPLPLQNQHFDTIILSDVLEHIPTPENLWLEMARIIKPGGHLLVSVPFYYWLHEEPHDYYRYTEHALKRFASLSGFEILVMEQYGGVPEILADILAKNIINFHWRFGPLFADYIQRLVSWYVSQRKQSTKKLSPFPLGYFLVAQKIGV